VGDVLTTEAAPAVQPARPARRWGTYLGAGAAGMLALALVGLLVRERTSAPPAARAAASEPVAPPASVAAPPAPLEKSATTSAPSVEPPASSSALPESMKAQKAAASRARGATTPAPLVTSELASPAPSAPVLATGAPAAIPVGGDVEAATARRK
jgi:hypothetical protein